MIKPSAIDAVARNVQEDEKADISTLIRVLKGENEINNPNLVKCVIDKNNYALYFSRSKFRLKEIRYAEIFTDIWEYTVTSAKP